MYLKQCGLYVEEYNVSKVRDLFHSSDGEAHQLLTTLVRSRYIWLDIRQVVLAFLWTKTKSIEVDKKEGGQYLAILSEQAWSTKDLSGKFLEGKMGSSFLLG